MPQHYFHIEGLSYGFLGIVVLFSYVCSTLALVVMIRDGFRLKTYGMPPLGIVSMLAVCLICVFGPFSGQSHLFFPKSEWKLTATWALDAVLLGVILFQYLRYAPRDPRLPPDRVEAFRLFVWGQLAVVVAGFWTFIVYYQDYYVNEACPIAILIMTAGYVASIHLRRDLRGLSLTAGWLLGISNLLLYGGVYAGNMSDPYPEAEYGYHFIYWLYGLTLAMNLGYVRLLALHKRDARRSVLSAAGAIV
jgi:hypothetical protein